MTASPAFSVGLGRSVLARVGIVALVTLALWALVAWRLATPDVAPGLLAAALAATLAVVALGGWLWPAAARRLRWDGRRWQLGRAGRPIDEDRAGEAEVMLDTGIWMLLRFRADTPSRPGHAAWLAVQRGSVDG